MFATRIASIIPVAVGVSVITFCLTNILPGSLAGQLLGSEATPELIAQFEEKLGLQRPAIDRYLEWLYGMTSGNLGLSLASGQPVAALISERLPITLLLAAYTILIALLTSVVAATACAYAPGSAFDRIVQATCVAGLSTANYVFAMTLILMLSVKLEVFPAYGYAHSSGILALLRSLTLPALSIALPLFCLYTRFLRADLVEQLHSSYAISAAARGFSEFRILVRHVLPNALPGLVTIVGVHVTTLIGGTVVIEQMFGLPGIGQLLAQSVQLRDFTVVQALVFWMAIGTVVSTLLADAACTVLNPRLRQAI